jgi:hypothetical protein
MIPVPNAIIPYWPKPVLYAFPANPRNVKAEKLVAIKVNNKIIGPNVLLARK